MEVQDQIDALVLGSHFRGPLFLGPVPVFSLYFDSLGLFCDASQKNHTYVCIYEPSVDMQPGCSTLCISLRVERSGEKPLCGVILLKVAHYKILQVQNPKVIQVEPDCQSSQ